ncbi:MAG: YihY/virulence factor BrkB family protein [Armatimonadaceae bacterium]
MRLTLKRLKVIVIELFRRFGEDNGPAGAATISFFAILSFVPLLLVGIAVLGYVIQDPQVAAARIERFIAQLIPGPTATQAAEEIIQNAGIEEQVEGIVRGSGWAWIFGIVSLVWSASRIFANAIIPLNAAFNAEDNRSFLQKQGAAVAMLFGAGFLFILSLIASALPALLNQLPVFQLLPDVTATVLSLMALALSISLNATMFGLIYRYLPSPRAKVCWRQALVGGGFVAVLWEILKQGFAFYLSRFGGGESYNRVYGSLGGLIILFLWVYYSSILLLLGAEVAQMFGDWLRKQKGDSSDDSNKLNSNSVELFTPAK